MIIEIFKAILFGLVEGITEWLPVSSTGHMILLDEVVKLNVSKEFYKLFEVVIQLGAIMAVIIIFWKKIFPFYKARGKVRVDRQIISLWGKILVATLPAAVFGLLLDDFLDKHLYNGIVVSLMLIIYGIIFIIIESKNIGSKTTKDLGNITYKQAFGVGGFQLLSLIPGTSRSGSTIIGGLILGLERSTIAEFTFFLAIPVMAGASLLKFLKYILKVGLIFTSTELIVLIVGCIVSFIISLIVIKFLLNYIRKHDFKVFGYYRIILGIIVLLWYFLK